MLFISGWVELKHQEILRVKMDLFNALISVKITLDNYFEKIISYDFIFEHVYQILNLF